MAGPTGSGLAGVVAAEEALAEHVERLLVTAEREHGALVVVPDLPGARLPADLADALRAADAAPGGISTDHDAGVVVTHAERLGLAEALELCSRVPDGGRVVLQGDPEAAGRRRGRAGSSPTCWRPGWPTCTPRTIDAGGALAPSPRRCVRGP